MRSWRSWSDPTQRTEPQGCVHAWDVAVAGQSAVTQASTSPCRRHHVSSHAHAHDGCRTGCESSTLNAGLAHMRNGCAQQSGGVALGAVFEPARIRLRWTQAAAGTTRHRALFKTPGGGTRRRSHGVSPTTFPCKSPQGDSRSTRVGLAGSGRRTCHTRRGHRWRPPRTDPRGSSRTSSAAPSRRSSWPRRSTRQAPPNTLRGNTGSTLWEKRRTAVSARAQARP